MLRGLFVHPFVQTNLILSGLYSGFGMNTRKEPVRQRLIRGVYRIRFEGPNNVELLSWCRGILDKLAIIKTGS